MSDLQTRPVKLFTRSPDQDGLLVMQRDRLVAILVVLSDQHVDLQGSVYVEFLAMVPGTNPTFATVADALAWIEEQLPSEIPQIPGVSARAIVTDADAS